MSEEVLGTCKVAQILRVVPRTVCNMIDRGILKAYKMPGTKIRRVAKSDLIEFIRSNGMPEDWVTEVKESK